jgi:hypothetical protein
MERVFRYQENRHDLQDGADFCEVHFETDTHPRSAQPQEQMKRCMLSGWATLGIRKKSNGR